MQNPTKRIVAAATLVLIFATGSIAHAGSSVAGTFSEGKTGWRLSWENKNRKYKNFTDAGNYLVLLNDRDEKDFSEANRQINKNRDIYRPHCTATVKRNSKGEVIIGRNMDVEISQNPAYIAKIKGKKHTAVSFIYGGINSKYKYDELDKLDKDSSYLKYLPYTATDAMNETGLFIEMNMREMDDSLPSIYCTGTNPKAKERACMISVPALVALNCSTVEEAVEYLRNSYNWYSLNFCVPGEKTTLCWNLAFVIGDAKGNYGLVEFGKNGVYYTPYQCGQGNYYIHPELAEYAITGSGYGRLAAALKGLPKCETERDMLDNMKNCMWKREILDPGCMGYSDFKLNINDRRNMTQKQLQEGFTKKLAPYQAAIKAYYAGDEKALRDDGTIWTTGFNFGVNCATKHLLLRLWERDNVIYEYQW